jgi:hypothetical protein
MKTSLPLGMHQLRVLTLQVGLCCVAMSAATCPASKYDGNEWPKGTRAYFDT